MVEHLIIYLVSFIVIWLGAGLALTAVEKLSKTLKLSSFALSFLILGFFTSVSELSVGVNAILVNDPEIYAGNLIGASIVIFLLIIPLLAITGNGLKITREMQGFNLMMSVLVIATPVLLSIDGKIDRYDSLIAISFFLVLVVTIQMKKGLLEHATNVQKLKASKVLQEFMKIIAGVVIIFIASKFIVNETLVLSQIFNVSPFLMSLLFIAIGTNIPELSFVIRSVFMKNSQIAFGDYVGSAAFNTFLFGFLTLMYGKPVYLSDSYLTSLVFLIFGLFLFYYFARTHHGISRGEGLILLFVYIAFLLIKLLVH